MTDLKPGPELDKAVADKMGMLPCDLWEPVNFGATGGPSPQKNCVHADGACYPTTEMGSVQGTFGGVPAFSDEKSPRALRLKDLPPGTTLTYILDGPWLIQSPSRAKTWRGVNEAHVLCLAFLDIGDFKFKQDGLWESHWKQFAFDIGIIEITPRSSDDLPLPWNPEALNWLDKLVTYVRGQAINSLSHDKIRDDPNTVWLGEKPKPPTGDEKVQKLLWKIRDAGIDSDTMTLVNDFLMRVWKDPGIYGEPKQHPLVL